MMEFLDKIYGYEHFGIILFAAIGVLLVLFLIVLFFGKKDEKKRELERTQKLAQEQVATTDTFATTNSESTSINVGSPTFTSVDEKVAPIVSDATVLPTEPVIQSTPVVNTTPTEEVSQAIEPVINETPVFEPIVPETPVVQPVAPEVPIAPVLEPIAEPSIVVPAKPTLEVPVTASVEAPTINIEPTVIPVVEENKEPEIKIPDFNFDELAASIANELNSLEKQNVSTVNVDNSQKIQESIIPNIPVEPVQAVVTPINEVVTPVEQKPNPGGSVTTFSSVYINKPAEPVVHEKTVIPVVEQAQETIIKPVVEMPAPVIVDQEPSIDLPKPAEMPALNTNVVNEEPLNNKPNTIPDFSQFEGESYDIK